MARALVRTEYFDECKLALRDATRPPIQGIWNPSHRRKESTFDTGHKALMPGVTGWSLLVLVLIGVSATQGVTRQ